MFKNIDKTVTRHGKTVYYFRKGKGPRVRINVEPHDANFELEYARAAKVWEEQSAKERELTEYEKVALARLISDRVKNARARDKKAGREGEITVEWVLQLMERQKYKCAATGIQFSTFSRRTHRMNPYHPSLDRLDGSKGYDKDNVRLVVLAFNMMRLDWGDDIFEDIARAYLGRGTAAPIAAPTSKTGKTQ